MKDNFIFLRVLTAKIDSNWKFKNLNWEVLKFEGLIKLRGNSMV